MTPTRPLVGAALAACLTGGPVLAQAPDGPPADPAPGASEAPADGALTLSLAEALELALTRSYAVQLARLEEQDALARIDEAWGSVYPRVDLSARYVRNLRVANPFAGSDAGSFFGGLDAIGWLAYNEAARQNGAPTLSLLDYQQRVADGRSAAGLSNSSSDNPFLVENQITAGLAITQTLYNGAAFAAIRGAEAYQKQVEAQVRQRQQEVARDVARAYHGALLAEARAEVTAKAVARVQETVDEVSDRVKNGVLPMFQQLSAEVELANLQTALLQVRAGADAAKDGLKLAIGLPPDQPIALRGALEIDAPMALDGLTVDLAAAEAERNRPDLETIRRTREMLAVQQELTDARYLPVLSAFANVGITGSVPDERVQAVQDPMDPFRFTKKELGVFDGDYWFDTSNIGLSLTWNLFDGFQTTQQAERDRVAVRRIEVQQAQALAGVRAEIQGSLRALRTAQAQLANVDRNVARAELNYQHAKARVDEGVSTRLELREASSQLDQSQFNRLQAVHDYLDALVAYRIAVGRPLAGAAGSEAAR